VTRAARLRLAALAALLADAPLAPAADLRAGTVQEYAIPSRHQGKDRRVWVYTPPGAPRDSGLGMIVAFDGGDYLNAIALPHVLDSLFAVRAVPPLIAVLIDDGSGAARLDDLANRAWFVDFVCDEVVPWVRARWPVSRDPRRALITGTSAGGLAALHVALRRPELFGNAFSQSGAFWRGSEASNAPPYEWLAAQVARWPRAATRLRLEVGSTETRGALGGSAPSILSANRAMRDSLRARGYVLTYVEVPNGVHAPETWAPRLPAALVALLGGK
jgi:enterochelin esterase-like enzyme